MKKLIIFTMISFICLSVSLKSIAQISGPTEVNTNETEVYSTGSWTRWSIEANTSHAYIVSNYFGEPSVTINTGSIPGSFLIVADLGGTGYRYLTVNVVGEPLHTEWEYVGSPAFSDSYAYYTNLEFAGSTPYVAYRDYAYSNSTTVKKFDGNNWINVGSQAFTPGNTHFQSLAMVGNTPYVAFCDFGENYHVKVMKFNGTDWVNVGTSNFASGYSVKLKISGGIPYVAFLDLVYGEKATVMKFDGNNWVLVGNQGFSEDRLYHHIAFEISEGIPYVAYTDMLHNGKAIVKKFDGTNWVNVGNPDFSAGYSYFHSLAFDEYTPYISFSDAAFGYYSVVMKFDGINWVYVGAPFALANEHISLKINRNTPYIAFCDGPVGARTSVMKFNGTTWVYVDVPGFSLGNAYCQSLAFYGNTPYVAFTGNETGISVMKFEDEPLPVELSSFTYSVNNNNVNLKWTTASETNNSGFDLERKDARDETQDVWKKISFINGHGTSSSPNNYEFTDRNLSSGKYKYRLKQIDFNGNYEYYDLSDEVVIGVPDKFELSQNYPNPFNPSTVIRYSLSENSFVTLKVYDVIGNGVATLVSEKQNSGTYNYQFSTVNYQLSSGVYFYKITAGSFSAVKRMILIK